MSDLIQKLPEKLKKKACAIAVLSGRPISEMEEMVVTVLDTALSQELANQLMHLDGVSGGLAKAAGDAPGMGGSEAEADETGDEAGNQLSHEEAEEEESGDGADDEDGAALAAAFTGQAKPKAPATPIKAAVKKKKADPEPEDDDDGGFPIPRFPHANDEDAHIDHMFGKPADELEEDPQEDLPLEVRARKPAKAFSHKRIRAKVSGVEEDDA